VVRPKLLLFGSTEQHPEPQLLLRVHDDDRDADRDYTVKGIRGVKEYTSAQHQRLVEREGGAPA